MTEHKRLTTKEKYPHGAEGVSKDKLTGRYCRGVFEATACVEKLAEYETAEEEAIKELEKIKKDLFSIGYLKDNKSLRLSRKAGLNERDTV